MRQNEGYGLSSPSHDITFAECFVEHILGSKAKPYDDLIKK